jgi:hypothetical protein
MAAYNSQVIDMPAAVAVGNSGESAHQTGPTEWKVRTSELGMGG